jgi:hypothetical protein
MKANVHGFNSPTDPDEEPNILAMWQNQGSNSHEKPDRSAGWEIWVADSATTADTISKSADMLHFIGLTETIKAIYFRCLTASLRTNLFFSIFASMVLYEKSGTVKQQVELSRCAAALNFSLLPASAPSFL